MSDLRGKVALVTGGSRGMGAEIARRLARDGADVAITYSASADKARAVVADIESQGRRGLALAADSADPTAIVGAVEQTRERLGRLDILVNNAGVFFVKPLGDYTFEDYERMTNVNVRAVFLGSQAAAAGMDEGGRIISIGSCIARNAGSPGMTLYALSKAALIGLTKGLAHDLGARGITANVVDPGPIDTEMNPADGDHADFQRTQNVLGRYGEPSDIAAMVAHLAGEHGRFITGASIAVDAGFLA